MNPLMQRLNPYPFQKLKQLMQGIQAAEDMQVIHLHIGEPKHATPTIITEALTQSLYTLSQYPSTAGLIQLRMACAQWLQQRYDVMVNSDTELLPVNGSREALFSFVQASVDSHIPQKPVVIVPNPFYQIYEGAAFLAGADVAYVNTFAPNFKPNWEEIDEKTWNRTQIVFVCSPGNPTGAVLNKEDWQEIFTLQDQYQFIIASDECYSEIYEGIPPLGILQAAQQLGRNFDKKIMFTSLSKRSNVPSLRSGFVAGDAQLLKQFLLYRTYHGSAMSLPTQYASIAAWSDEDHVLENRRLYQEKFAQVLPILQQRYEVIQPDASFYLWLKVSEWDNDLIFTQKLYAQQAIQVLPGSFLSRDTQYGNAGKNYVRIALVDTLEQCIIAAQRILLLQ